MPGTLRLSSTGARFGPRFGPWVCIASVVPVLRVLGVQHHVTHGGIDSFYYTGYTRGYGYMVEMFGRKYFANRVSVLWPGRALDAVFGDFGYDVFRWLIVVMTLGALYVLFAQRYSRAVGLGVALFVGFNPWYQRHLADDYVTGFAASYLIVAFVLLSLRTNRPRLQLIAAGAFAALAVNAYPAALAMLAPWAVAAFALWAWRSRVNLRRAVGKALLVAGGFGALYLALFSIMGVLYPKMGFFFEKSSIEISRALVNSEGFYVPYTGSLNWMAPLVGVPFGVLALGLAIVWKKARPRGGSGGSGWGLACPDLVWLALGGLSGGLLLGLIWHFPFHGGMLVAPLSLVLFLPATVVAAGVVIGEHFVGVDQKLRNRVLIGAVVLQLLTIYVVPRWTGLPERPSVAWTVTAFTFLTLLVVAVLAPSRRRSSAATAVVIAVLFTLAPGATLLTKTLRGWDFSRYREWAFGDGRGREDAIDTFARQFSDVIRDRVPASATIRFWYPDEPQWLSSVQSTFLWNETCVGCFLRMSGFPGLNDRSLPLLESSDYVTLLAPSRTELDEAETNLAQSGLRLEPTLNRSFHANGLDLYVRVLKNVESRKDRGSSARGKSAETPT